MKIIILVAILAFLCSQTFSIQQANPKEIQDILESLKAKYCQSLNTHCKTMKNDNTNNQGLGWNKVKRQYVFPIHKNFEISKDQKITDHIYQYKNAQEFFSNFQSTETIHPMHSDLQWIEKAFSTFNTKVYVTSKNYGFSLVNAVTNKYTKEFQQFLQLLPVPFDPNSNEHQYYYSLFFDLFGTDVLNQVRYGGSIYQISIVKECKNIENETLQELNAKTNGNTFTSDYLKYRRASNLIIQGGNPEISSVTERIQSFIDAQVPIEFNKSSILQFVPDEKLNPSIEMALNWYTRLNSFEQETIRKIEKAKQEDFLSTRSVHVFLVLHSNHWHNGVLVESIKSIDTHQYNLSANQTLVDTSVARGNYLRVERNEQGLVKASFDGRCNVEKKCNTEFNLNSMATECYPEYIKISPFMFRLCGPSHLVVALDCVPVYTENGSTATCACKNFD